MDAVEQTRNYDEAEAIETPETLACKQTHLLICLEIWKNVVVRVSLIWTWLRTGKSRRNMPNG